MECAGTQGPCTASRAAIRGGAMLLVVAGSPGQDLGYVGRYRGRQGGRGPAVGALLCGPGGGEGGR